MNIPKSFLHHFDDETKAEKTCSRILSEFGTNQPLRILSKSWQEVEDSINENSDNIDKDIIVLLKRSWIKTLHYYALMDNPRSPMQVFKSDYHEKSLCAAQTLGVEDIISLIDDISPNKETLSKIDPADIDTVRNAMCEARMKYDAVVSDYEWQSILDWQRYIYNTRVIILSSNIGLKPEQIAKVQAEKGELMANMRTAQIELREALSKFYGEDSLVKERIERQTQIKTVFEAFSLEKKDFINIGQGKKWEKK